MRYACPRGIYSRLSRAGVRGETGFVRRRWAAGVPDDLLQAARRIELECPKGIGRIELEAALRDERRCIGLSGDVVQRTAGVLEQLPLEAPAPRRQHQGQQNPARALRRSWSSAFDRRRRGLHPRSASSLPHSEPPRPRPLRPAPAPSRSQRSITATPSASNCRLTLWPTTATVVVAAAAPIRLRC
jgi:hypothetical protein